MPSPTAPTKFPSKLYIFITFGKTFILQSYRIPRQENFFTTYPYFIKMLKEQLLYKATERKLKRKRIYSIIISLKNNLR